MLVTNRLSCNTADERRVYLTQQIIHDLEALMVTVQTQSVAWKDVAKTMTIDYLEIEDRSDSHGASEVDQDGSHGELCGGDTVMALLFRAPRPPGAPTWEVSSEYSLLDRGWRVDTRSNAKYLVLTITQVLHTAITVTKNHMNRAGWSTLSTF